MNADWLLDHVTGVASHLISTPLIWTEQFFVVYLLTFVLLAYVAFRMNYRPKSVGPVSFLRFLFPKRIYLHRSAWIDYGIYPVNLLLAPLTSLFGVALQSAISLYVGNALVGMNGGAALVVGDWTVLTWLIFIVGYTLTADLSVYIVHRVHHASSILWPIHALHHSAEVLTPVTLFRKHPLWNFTANILAKTMTGVFGGMFVFVFYGSPTFELLFGINTIYVLYNFCGANLRHSHVWLSWGKPLSYVFISPAMHQIHHDPTRMNRNYGEIFALWDWMFGTLYIPEKRERFEVGLGDGEPNPHATLLRAYWVPVAQMFGEAGRAIRRATARA